MSTAFIVHRVVQGAFGPIPAIMEGFYIPDISQTIGDIIRHVCLESAVSDKYDPGMHLIII